MFVVNIITHTVHNTVESADRIYLEFEDDNLELYRHVIVWIDLPSQLCWQCKYCRNMYTELFSTEMIYRHLLRTESGNNREFNCQKVNSLRLPSCTCFEYNDITD
jgi:hypothetical protein